MHIETLRTFVALVRWRSFTRAAKECLVSQSAVSQQLAQLETMFKSQFIERTKRPLKLTNEGEIFYAGCRDILERYDNLRNELRSLQKSAANRVNIAAIFSIGMHSLQPYVKQFMAQYPNVNVHLEYLNAAEIYELVERGALDIGLVAVPEARKGIEIYPFRQEQLVFVCNPQHPLAHESTIEIDRLGSQPFIAFEEGIPTRRLIDQILQSAQVSVQRVMEFDNTETIKRAIEINAGVSILPETVVQAEVANGTLKAIPFSTRRSYVRPTGLIVRKEKVLSQPARYFIELLRGAKK